MRHRQRSSGADPDRRFQFSKESIDPGPRRFFVCSSAFSPPPQTQQINIHRAHSRHTRNPNRIRFLNKSSERDWSSRQLIFAVAGAIFKEKSVSISFSFPRRSTRDESSSTTKRCELIQRPAGAMIYRSDAGHHLPPIASLRDRTHRLPMAGGRNLEIAGDYRKMAHDGPFNRKLTYIGWLTKLQLSCPSPPL